MNVDELRLRLAESAAKEARKNRAILRSLVEGRPVDTQEVLDAIKALGIPVEVVEQAARLQRELTNLKVPSSEQVAALQASYERAHAEFYSLIERLRGHGVKALESGGGWGTKVHPLARPAFDADRAARFAWDAAVSAVSRREELQEKIAVLLGEKPAPTPPPRPQFKVEVQGSPIEDGYLRDPRMSRQTSKRIVKGPDGVPMIESFVRKDEPEGYSSQRPANEILKRFVPDGRGGMREAPLD